MNEAELKIGDEKLIRHGIVGGAAETGAGVVLAVVAEVGEQGDGARCAVDFPNGAGAAAFRYAELSRHPAGTTLAVDEPRAFLGDDLQPEQRCRRHVDVGDAVCRLAIERDAEHLADVSCRRLKR